MKEAKKENIALLHYKQKVIISAFEEKVEEVACNRTLLTSSVFLWRFCTLIFSCANKFSFLGKNVCITRHEKSGEREREGERGGEKD